LFAKRASVLLKCKTLCLPKSGRICTIKRINPFIHQKTPQFTFPFGGWGGEEKKGGGGGGGGVGGEGGHVYIDIPYWVLLHFHFNIRSTDLH
jgi:hypothetical protein